ncbi:hypothetical protein M9H77_17606 [Catharanthus roseus]|uniref:Uncharacterized protein n=1 Tax=Catharanthus roseus TaxID=4058 RepID=A0ACC0B548_CATRO|nr:hypothetical protein M9H77_17606 [Catharanthus roseus]
MDREQQRRRRPNLGPVADRSGRTHDRTDTASSQGLRGRHSISDIHTTLTPVDPSSAQPPYQRPPSSSYYPTASRTRPIGPVDPQLGSSFVDELLLGFQEVSPYSSQHMDYYGNSRYVPSYTLGSGEHGGDEGGEETVQAGVDDIDVHGDDLEDEAEHVKDEDEGKEDVDMGGGGTIVVVPPPSSGSRLSRGNE